MTSSSELSFQSSVHFEAQILESAHGYYQVTHPVSQAELTGEGPSLLKKTYKEWKRRSITQTSSCQCKESRITKILVNMTPPKEI